MHFADDIYHRDAAVMRALGAGALPLADAQRAIDALERLRAAQRTAGAAT